MPDDRLSKKVLFGQVKGCRPLGRPRLSFNDVTLHQVTVMNAASLGHTKMLRTDYFDLPCTHLAQHDLESVSSIRSTAVRL